MTTGQTDINGDRKRQTEIEIDRDENRQKTEEAE